MQRPSPAPTGLSFEVQPPDAEIVINGVARARVADLAADRNFLALEPGIYQIVLRRPGYATWRAEVAVRALPERIAVVLEPRR